MLKLGALLICFAFLAVPQGASAAPRTGETRFEDYAVPVYRGPVVQPSFRGPQRRFATYRTRIRHSVEHRAIFGGHYAVAIAGCGTGCRFGFVTDLRTGIVSDLPLGGEEYSSLLYRLRPDSRLLQTQWETIEDPPETRGCMLEDFLVEGGKFRSMGRKRVAQCPDWDDYAD